MFAQTKTTCSPTVNWPKFEQKLTLIRCVWFGESYIFRPLKMKRILKCDVRQSLAHWLCHCMSEFAMNVRTFCGDDATHAIVCFSFTRTLLLPQNMNIKKHAPKHTHSQTRIRSHTENVFHIQLTWYLLDKAFITERYTI